jgi:hypothetical protein
MNFGIGMLGRKGHSRGMPSTHGVEWKDREVSKKKFDDNYDKIDWSNGEKENQDNCKPD